MWSVLFRIIVRAHCKEGLCRYNLRSQTLFFRKPMGYARKAAAFLTADEYLALETRARTKHEYLEGVIYAWQGQVPESMAGGSRAHHRISLNIATALNAALQGTPRAPYMADMRLRVAAAAGRTETAYFYPDVLSIAGRRSQRKQPRLKIQNCSSKCCHLAPRNSTARKSSRSTARSRTSRNWCSSIRTHHTASRSIAGGVDGSLVLIESGDAKLPLASAGVTMTRGAVLAGV
ncbi:MAG: hypothetical protein EXR36_02675 [Betaproteobacteria bacterium]|nr:hypothetical protein [Betaproteobacteria bacterium]